MQPVDLLQALLELADEVGLEVRATRGAGEGEPSVSSGVCRVRGRVWVVLAATDPVDAQIAVLARALVAAAGETLEARFVPPAVREALDRGRGR